MLGNREVGKLTKDQQFFFPISSLDYAKAYKCTPTEKILSTSIADI